MEAAPSVPVRGVSGISRLYQEIFLGIYIPVVKSLLVAFLLRAGVGGAPQSWARGRRGRASGVTILVPTDRTGGPPPLGGKQCGAVCAGAVCPPQQPLRWLPRPGAGGGSEGGAKPTRTHPSVCPFCLPSRSFQDLCFFVRLREATEWACLMRPSSAARRPARSGTPRGHSHYKPKGSWSVPVMPPPPGHPISDCLCVHRASWPTS